MFKKIGVHKSQIETSREVPRPLKEPEDLNNLHLAELRDEIRRGVEQADRGGLIDGKKAFATIRVKSHHKK